MIHPIPAFNDNYIWILVDNDSSLAWVVDPGDARPVIDYLATNNLQLEGIIITHHHKDHTGGVLALREKYQCVVAGPNHLTELVTQPLSDQDHITIQDSDFQIIATPGHTLDHLCYYSDNFQGDKILFCGDTLFRGGCGRLFEGSPRQMHESLNKLAKLPAETLVYCTHEYTLANYKFALALDPSNQILQQNYQESLNLRDQDIPTLPSKIHIEQETNPFLRSDVEDIYSNAAQYIDQQVSDESIVRFAQIRQAKDIF